MDDYISRESVQSKIVAAYFDESPFPTTIRDLLDDVAAIPAADVRPVKRGEWIETEATYAEPPKRQSCKCSNCKKFSPRPLGDFCRWCGADMRGEDDA